MLSLQLVVNDESSSSFDTMSQCSRCFHERSISFYRCRLNVWLPEFAKQLQVAFISWDGLTKRKIALPFGAVWIDMIALWTTSDADSVGISIHAEITPVRTQSISCLKDNRIPVELQQLARVCQREYIYTMYALIKLLAYVKERQKCISILCFRLKWIHQMLLTVDLPSQGSLAQFRCTSCHSVW